MYHLRLCKGLSYTNGTITATRQQPDVYIEDKAVADSAAASGFFAFVEDAEDTDVVGHLDREQLESMTVSSLKKLAGDMDVNIKGLKDKAAIIDAIMTVGVSASAFDAETLAGMNLDELTAYAAENDISLDGVPATKEGVLEAICVANGGSYTMLDLQEQ